jgi:hypothetical protein
MKYQLTDIVVLKRKVPEEGLEAGDVGTVVELYEPTGVEVEFITEAGRTLAVVTLDETDVRSVGPDDLRAVRPPRPRRR